MYFKKSINPQSFGKFLTLVLQGSTEKLIYILSTRFNRVAEKGSAGVLGYFFELEERKNEVEGKKRGEGARREKKSKN